MLKIDGRYAGMKIRRGTDGQSLVMYPWRRKPMLYVIKIAGVSLVN